MTLGPSARADRPRRAPPPKSTARSVAEAELVLAVTPGRATSIRSAHVDPGARLGAGTIVGAARGDRAERVLGRNCKVGASAVIDGHTTIGDGTEVFPVRVDRSAAAGPEIQGRADQARDRPAQHLPRVRDDPPRHGRRRRRDDDRRSQPVHGLRARRARLPCRQRDDFRPGSHARRPRRRSTTSRTISAYSGVHQFCRVGRYAFIGGYSVVTKDALPFAQTVGARVCAASIGLNTIGLCRRGFADDTLDEAAAAPIATCCSRS